MRDTLNGKYISDLIDIMMDKFTKFIEYLLVQFSINPQIVATYNNFKNGFDEFLYEQWHSFSKSLNPGIGDFITCLFFDYDILLPDDTTHEK